MIETASLDQSSLPDSFFARAIAAVSSRPGLLHLFMEKAVVQGFYIFFWMLWISLDFTGILCLFSFQESSFLEIFVSLFASIYCQRIPGPSSSPKTKKMTDLKRSPSRSASLRVSRSADHAQKLRLTQALVLLHATPGGTKQSQTLHCGRFCLALRKFALLNGLPQGRHPDNLQEQSCRLVHQLLRFLNLQLQVEQLLILNGVHCTAKGLRR